MDDREQAEPIAADDRPAETELPADVIAAREAADALAATVGPALDPTLEAVLENCRIALKALANQHAHLADNSDLDLEGDTRWAARWGLAAAAIGGGGPRRGLAPSASSATVPSPRPAIAGSMLCSCRHRALRRRGADEKQVAILDRRLGERDAWWWVADVTMTTLGSAPPQRRALVAPVSYPYAPAREVAELAWRAVEPIRQMDPVFREIFEHHTKIRMDIDDIQRGVRVTETSDDPQVVLLIRQHAQRAVSEFVADGMQRAMRPTPLPRGYRR